MAPWTFVTSHGAVLAVIAQHGQITARDIAERLGMTERPVRRIIADLETAGYLIKHRTGRVNKYQVNHTLPLRRFGLRDIEVGALLQVLQRSLPPGA
ncbi:MAG: helix-turn-helix transcriptional regulator [Candidatus Tectimicrobiota bacterium]